MKSHAQENSWYFMWLSFAIICLEMGNGFFSRPPLAPLHSSVMLLNQRLPSSSPVSQASSLSAGTTNVTITVPRFYSGEVPDGSYPSALHSIHVESILTPEEAARCLTLAKTYAIESGCWNQPDSARHQTYATCDFAIEECETLETYLKKIGFNDRLWNRMSTLYVVEVEDLMYLDFFCANYRARDGRHYHTMDRLEAHRDGSLLSFTVLLTPPSQFAGGGTFFDALRDVEPDDNQVDVLFPSGVIRPPRVGDCVMHSGKLLHGADVVMSGERTILVGFIDVADCCLRPDVLFKACRDFGRMDVAKKRYKRQQKMTENGGNGWLLNNSRWLPDSKRGTGRSHIRGFSPTFLSVATRADPGYQRRMKLEAEDILLRTILLPEKPEVDDLFPSDFTIL